MTASSPLASSAQPRLSALLPYWPVTLAAFLGWFLDAFDQTALMFTLPDIARDLGCTLSALGGVLLGQAIGRAVGNTGWGWLADRFGRKPAFMLGVVWFGVFSALTGLTHSLTMLMIVQFCFGVGFGGEWTASAALLMESVPDKLRPMASALMMSGYEVGYLAAAAAQALILPHHSWRLLFFIGLLPAFLSFFIRLGVKESPVWLAAVAQKSAEKIAEKKVEKRVGEKTFESRDSPKERNLLRQSAPASWTSAGTQAVLLMAFLEFQKAAIYTFYPTILRSTHHLDPQMVFWPVCVYCIGSFLGKLACGVLATRFGDTKIMLTALAVSLLTIWPFLCAPTWSLLLASAFVMGAAASGIFALVPSYLAQRFPAARRSFGMGLSYAVGSLGQGLASKLVPFFGRTAATLPLSAVAFVVGSGVVTAAVVLFRPKSLPGLQDDLLLADARHAGTHSAPAGETGAAAERSGG